MACQRCAGCRSIETFTTLVLIVITSEVFASNQSDACETEENYPSKTRTHSWSSPPTAKLLNIGTALTLNFSSTYGGHGKQLAQAYALWFDWLNEEMGGLDINGEKYYVKLHLIDDNSNAESVANITRYLLFEKKINLFLGPYGSTLTRAAAEVLNTTGAVMVCGSASSTSVFKDRPRLFGLLAPASKNLGPFFNMRAHFAMYSSEPPRTIAYLYQDQPFPRGVCGVVDSLAEEHGLTVVFGADNTGKFNDEKDVSPLMAKIAATKADVLIGCVYAQVCKQILDDAKKLQYDPKAVLFTVCVTAENYRDLNGDAGGYVMGVAPWTREVQTISSFTNMSVQEFVKRFEDRYRSRITYQATAAFASAATLTQGIIDAQTVSDTGKIAEAIRNLNRHSEFGLIAFDENGQGKNPYKVVQAQGDAMPVIAPRWVASAFPSYPKPSFDSMLCYNSNELDLGRHGIAANGSCLRCNSAEVAPYQMELGYRVCKKKVCPPGHHSLIFENIKSDKSNVSIIGAYCPKCFPGYYTSTSGFTQCKACEVGKHQIHAGATTCEICPAGRHTGNIAAINCQKCNSGRYSSKEGSSRCVTCPAGSYCTTDSEASVVEYTNADGFFLFTIDDQELPLLVPCSHGEQGSACVQGGTCYVDAETGLEAMEGPFCGACRNGYGRSNANEVCKKCSDLPMLIFLVFVQGFLILFFAGAIFLLITWADLTKPKNLAAVILRQCMNYMGMTTVVFQVIDLRFPVSMGFVTDMVHYLRVFFGTSSPLFVSHAGNCMAAKLGSPYKVYVILGLAWVPLWVLFLTVAFHSIRGYQQWRLATPLPRSKLVTLLVVNLFVIHPRTTQLSLVVFNCNYFEKPRLMMDTTVDCQSKDLLLWQGLGLLGFVLYSLGIPFGTFLLLRSHKNAPNPKNSIHAKSTIRKLGFLYAGFESQHYYFECVFMLRKVLYQIVILIPPMTSSTPEHDRSIKCMSMLFLAVVYLAIHMWCMPYDNRAYFSLDRVEAASLWAIVISLLVQSWTLISNEASLFKKSSHAVLSDHSQNADMRDAIAAILVFCVHARFCLLAVYLTFRPILASVTKWTIFDHGFVEIRENGLYLREADSRGRRLFSGMFRELVDLIVESKQGQLMYEEFKLSLQYIGANAAYHRAQDNFDLGLDIDDDEAVHTTVFECFRDRDNLMNLLGRAWRTFNANVVSTVQKTIDHTTNIVDKIGGDDTRVSVSRLSVNQKMQKERLHQMKHFNSDTVASTYGRFFSIDELQLAMVRIQREVGKIRQKESKTGMFGVMSSKPKRKIPHSKKYNHRKRTGDAIARVSQSMADEESGKKVRFTGERKKRFSLRQTLRRTRSKTSHSSEASLDVRGYDDEYDDEEPPEMSEATMLEMVQRDLKAKLATLQDRSDLVGKQHKLEMITHEIILRQHHHAIHEAHDFCFAGDHWYEPSSEEDEEFKTAKVGAGEHFNENIPAVGSAGQIHKVKTKYLRAWQNELRNELFPPEIVEREVADTSAVKFDPSHGYKAENTFNPHRYIEGLIGQDCYEDLKLQENLESRMPRSLSRGLTAVTLEAIHCTACETELEIDSNFCHNCGLARQTQFESGFVAGKEPIRGDVDEMSSHKVDAFMDFQKKQTMNEELKDLRFRTKLKVEAAESLLKEQTSELAKVRNQIARLQGGDLEKQAL